MITYLTAVNRVLRRLRESTVSTLSGASDYVALIGEFVNESKEEVEAAWSWNHQLKSLDVTLASGTAVYSLTGFTDEFTISSMFDATNSYYLEGPTTTVEIDGAANLSTGTFSGTYTWAMYGMDDDGYQKVKFYPTPTGSGTITVLGTTRSSYLTADADIIKAPWRPVVLGAYMRAVSERGEDGGAVYDEINRAYERALADAISFDANSGHHTKDWWVC